MIRVYTFKCDRCEREIEARADLDGILPECCGQPMRVKITMPAFMKLKWCGGNGQKALCRPNPKR